MDNELSRNIQLYYSLRAPKVDRGADVIPAKYYIPICIIVLYFLTEKYGLVDRMMIFVGCAVVPVAVWLFMKGLKPLVLYKNGDIRVPSTIGPTSRLVRKAEVKSYALLSNDSLALIGDNEVVLSIFRPKNFKKHELFKIWFDYHFEGLPLVPPPGRAAIPKPEKQKFGSIKFIIITALLLALVAYNIYLAVIKPL